MSDMKIFILCGDTEFEFPLKEENSAWYDLDGKVSEADGETLKLNADRDVYAVYTDRNGTPHYGTVGDEENKILADNDGIAPGQHFLFYENPEAKDRYL